MEKLLIDPSLGICTFNFNPTQLYEETSPISSPGFFVRMSILAGANAFGTKPKTSGRSLLLRKLLLEEYRTDPGRTFSWCCFLPSKMVQSTSIDPSTAAFLSFLIPGWGQIRRGKTLAGILWLVVVIAGYLMMAVPGLILQILCMMDAYWRE